MELFKADEFNAPKPNNFCRTCKYRQPTECGSITIQYCTKLKSNRTYNGYTKTKCKRAACKYYEEKLKKE